MCNQSIAWAKRGVLCGRKLTINSGAHCAAAFIKFDFFSPFRWINQLHDYFPKSSPQRSNSAQWKALRDQEQKIIWTSIFALIKFNEIPELFHCVKRFSPSNKGSGRKTRIEMHMPRLTEVKFPSVENSFTRKAVRIWWIAIPGRRGRLRNDKLLYMKINTKSFPFCQHCNLLLPFASFLLIFYLLLWREPSILI